MSYKVIFEKVPVSVWVGLIFLTLFSLQIIWPMMQLRWDLVDDGITLAAAHLIENSLDQKDFSIAKPLFIEDQFVRFRPIFWLWFWLQFHLFGVDPVAFHLIRVGMFVISAWLLMGIVKKLTDSSVIGFLTASLYVVQPHDISNWYYLGHHEALQNLFLLASLYLALLYLKSGSEKHSKYFAWSSLALIPGIFWSKETSIALIPAIFVLAGFAWYKQQQKNFIFLTSYFFISVICAVILFGTLKYLSLNRPEGYFSMYQTSSQSTLLHTLSIYKRQLFENFSFLYVIPFITFIMYLGKKMLTIKLSEIDHWQLFFLISHVAFFVILLPFTLRAEGYYLAPSFLMYLLFAGLEAVRIYSLHRVLKFLVIGVILFLIGRNFIQVKSFVDEFVLTQLSNSEMMEYVVSQTPTAPNVLFNFSESDRGYIAGIRIQRASIFPCNQLMLTDPNVIYGQIDACPLQKMTHIPNLDSEIDVSRYELLVVGDVIRDPVVPLDVLQENSKSGLNLQKSIRKEVTVSDRNMTLEKYLLQTVKQMATNTKNTLRTRRIQMPFQPYPSRSIKTGWDIYRVEK